MAYDVNKSQFIKHEYMLISLSLLTKEMFIRFKLDQFQQKKQEKFNSNIIPSRVRNAANDNGVVLALPPYDGDASVDLSRPSLASNEPNPKLTALIFLTAFSTFVTSL